jgi:zinc/manganese transport system ATP-binding protein
MPRPRARLAIRASGLDVDLSGHAALRGAAITAFAGEITAIVGPNGAGKSTLIETLAGLHPLGAGTLESPFTDSVALVPQRSAIPAHLPITVGELVAMGRWRHAGPWRRLRRADRVIVDESLEAVDLTSLRRRPVGALSGGQLQRALVAQGLAQRARLLLLDEPMTALDAQSKSAVNTALLAAADVGAAVIVVTHDLSDLARVDAVVTLAAPPH